MTAPHSEWVYSFDSPQLTEAHFGSKEGLRTALGGKGANLAEMTRIGVPVPPGFTITTACCISFLKHGGNLPAGVWESVLEAMKDLEEKTGKEFGRAPLPLLVSCRSGAKFSMPGMMETVLNIGLHDGVLDSFIEATSDARFVYDSYRRLIQMFATVVFGLDDEPFEELLAAAREKEKVENDSLLCADTLRQLSVSFQRIVQDKAGRPFPQDPVEQLRLSIEAVFRSWEGKRAIDYRKAAHIPDNLGTAVNIVSMVFGNLGSDSGTGVATTRNVSTGEPGLEGDYLVNAQGEDVVAGTRQTERVQKLEADFPQIAEEFSEVCARLEQHYGDVQDIEFTIERGKLWILQTRNAKRTPRAAVRIAVDLADEALISRPEAVLRVSAEQIDYFLHPQFASRALVQALAEGNRLTEGLNVSPGAAVGQIAMDADTAEQWAVKEKRDVILVRQETKPDDVHGMLAANGILTSRGGRTSHAALVARQFGKPAVTGAGECKLDFEKRELRVSGRVFKEGDYISVDGSTGFVYAGKIPTERPSLNDSHLLKLLSWADECRKLKIYANADYPRDALRAKEYGAQGIGLCRTEHMFFETERLPIVQKMILASEPGEREEALAALLPLQRGDFHGLFEAMDGCHVIIRLIDPPLHEFLPDHESLLTEVTSLRITHQDDTLLAKDEKLLTAVDSMREQNPMLGLRGVRLGIHIPELVKMQVRAIFEAACACARKGIKVFPEVMIPLASHANELKEERRVLEEVVQQVLGEQDMKVPYKFGTMIEIPRAAITADQLAEYAEFFSFGTNDLTQTTFGISRDDAESGFLLEYLEKGILPENPFEILDRQGVGKLMEMAVQLGRSRRPGLEVGICGEHGGEPHSIEFCHELGLSYVSCSPFRVPVARLAAAHAALKPK